MQSLNIQNLERTAEALLAGQGPVTPERIREVIGQLRVAPALAVTDDEAEWLARALEVRHDVSMRIGSALTERGFKPWLEAAQSDIDPYFWERYRKLLVEKKLSAQVIATVNADTSRTLGFLENPAKQGPWSRRGMVVGHVQSGKTSNYIGLICKAADAGYRLVVVIAGVHNNLRNQTQRRLDEGFVGRDSARLLNNKVNQYIGVGRYDATRRPVTFTNSLRDFTKQAATGVGVSLHNLNVPAVFVIKKNTSTLTNLIEWLKEHSGRADGSMDFPMLVIDDEADNASINVAYGKDEVSRINGQIRQLLKLSSRNCYVGYTATPFANIFIDPATDDEMLGEDLFPRHFIVSLDPPSNYFGPDVVFRRNRATTLRSINDHDVLLPATHAMQFVVKDLPPSLLRASRTFIVARAIRLARGQRSEHCSMLVNASRFTGIQSQLRTKIEAVVDNMRTNIRVHAALPEAEACRDPEVAELRRIWKIEFAESGSTWKQVQENLLDAVAPVKVVEVNNRSHGTLNYEEYDETGLSVIAVGGYSLSRGLTIEGLTVSYYLRNSMMYDTLMQMGRWFGYRTGYQDLCRVWMPQDAENWYAHIAESIEELREELRTMAAAGATPEEFGLKVRAHPSTLVVTARNKMGAGEKVTVSIGLANRFVETATLRIDKESLQRNRGALTALAKAVDNLGSSFSTASQQKGGYLLRDVPAGPIKSFIGGFANHPLSLLTEPGPLVKYIEGREESELGLWDVFVPSLETATETFVDRTLGIEVNCQRRSAGDRSDGQTLRVTNKQRVASRGVEKTGLDEAAIKAAEESFRHANRPDASGDLSYPDHIYRAQRVRPLLVVHLLQIRDGGTKADWNGEPVIAWSISFPTTRLPEQRIDYVVTAQWRRENFGDDLGDDEEFESDDS